MEKKLKQKNKHKQLCYVGKQLSFWGLNDYLKHVTKCAECTTALSSLDR